MFSKTTSAIELGEREPHISQTYAAVRREKSAGEVVLGAVEELLLAFCEPRRRRVLPVLLGAAGTDDVAVRLVEKITGIERKEIICATDVADKMKNT